MVISGIGPATFIAGPILWRGPQRGFGDAEPKVRHCVVWHETHGVRMKRRKIIHHSIGNRIASFSVLLGIG